MSTADTSNDKRSQRERMLAGDLYIADDHQLTADNHRAMRHVEKLNHSWTTESQRVRRYDRGRRDPLVSVTLDLVAQGGRRSAPVDDVPLPQPKGLLPTAFQISRRAATASLEECISAVPTARTSAPR